MTLSVQEKSDRCACYLERRDETPDPTCGFCGGSGIPREPVPADMISVPRRSIEELKRALDFYVRAASAPNGIEVGAVRDANEWLLSATREVVKL